MLLTQQGPNLKPRLYHGALANSSLYLVVVIPLALIGNANDGGLIDLVLKHGNNFIATIIIVREL